MIVCSADSERREPRRAAALKAAGAGLLVPERDDLRSAFRALFARGVTSIVVEGGAALHRSTLETDMVDAAHVYITPHRLGPGGLRWTDAGRIAWETVPHRHARWLGEDLLVEGRLTEVSVHVHRDR
jgi:riboflavin biosynthesis pyrimidine reductase